MDYMVYKCIKMRFATQKQISECQIEDEDYHIYMIVSKPQLLVVGGKDNENNVDDIIVKLKSGNEELTYHFDTSKFEEVSFKGNDNRLSFKLELTNKLGENVNETIKAKDLYLRVMENQEFNIEYIGKSFGEKGERTSEQRLKNHSTLQRILADNEDAIEKKDIFIILFDITPLVINTITGPEQVKIGEFLDDPSLYTSLIEAKLINYFKPEYNDKFVSGVVPSESHTSYNELMKKNYYGYEIDFAINDSSLQKSYKLSTKNNSVTIVNGVPSQLVREKF